MATLDEVISQMSEEDYFSDPIQFVIDTLQKKKYLLRQKLETTLQRRLQRSIKKHLKQT